MTQGTFLPENAVGTLRPGIFSTQEASKLPNASPSKKRENFENSESTATTITTASSRGRFSSLTVLVVRLLLSKLKLLFIF